MRKINKNCFYLFILLTIFILSIVEYSYARAGGGGGGGGSGFSTSGKNLKIDTYIYDYFSQLINEQGFSYAFFQFMPLFLLNFLSCIAYVYYNYERPLHRFLYFLVYFYLGIYSYISLCLSTVLVPMQLSFLVDFIIKRIKYGHYLTKKEYAQIQFEEEYKIEEEKVLQNFKDNYPSFSLEKFKNRVINAFKIIQNNWMKQDLTESEKFLADGTYEQFQIQINEMKDNNFIDIISDLEILSVRLIKAETSTDYDSIYVAIQAKAINYLQNKETLDIIKGDSKETEVFSEIWCFYRRKGSKELNNNGLIEGYCPNCGTPISGSRLIQCPSCEALLKSGQHDWILAGIYQCSEWRNTHNDNIPGLRTLYLYDPYFNIQNIEDKLAANFWRLIQAIRLKKIDPIIKISSDSFAQIFKNSNFKNDEICYYNLAGIDSIEIIGIFRENNKHILLGQIIWNGCTEEIKSRTFHKKSIFVLQRDINSKTDIRKCFCSLHCQNCGALEKSNSLNYCEYCNTVSNDDTKDWILTNIISGFSSLAYSYINKSEEYNEEFNKLDSNLIKEQGTDFKQLNNNLEKKYNCYTILDKYNLFSKYSIKDTLRLCIAIMLADGVIDKNELKFIRKICEKYYISEEKLQLFIKEMLDMENPVEYVLKTAAIELDLDLLKLLIQIAASDGNIDKTEKNLIIKIANKMNYPKIQLDGLFEKYSVKKNWFHL